MALMTRDRRYNPGLLAGEGIGTGFLLLVVLIVLVAMSCR